MFLSPLCKGNVNPDRTRYHFPLFRASRAYVHLQRELSDVPPVVLGIGLAYQAVWIGRHIPLFAVQGLESLRQLPGPRKDFQAT